MMDTLKRPHQAHISVNSVKVSLANCKMLIHHLNQAHRQYVDSDDWALTAQSYSPSMAKIVALFCHQTFSEIAGFPNKNSALNSFSVHF